MINTKDMRNLRSTKKLYDFIVKDVCEKYGLGRPELDIIAFLHGNSGMDVASDIVDYCILSKANVSQAVDRLIRKQLLVKVVDADDRRRIHLSLTETAAPIVEDFDRANELFRCVLVSGKSAEELAVYDEVSRRMADNAINFFELK